MIHFFKKCVTSIYVTRLKSIFKGGVLKSNYVLTKKKNRIKSK